MENWREDIGDLILRIKALGVSKDWSVINKMLTITRSNPERLELLEKLDDKVNNEINSIIDLKEQYIQALNKKLEILEETSKYDTAETIEKIREYEDKQKSLTRRLESINVSIKNLEEKNDLSKFYYVLKDNQETWKKQISHYNDVLEALELSNKREIKESIENMIDNLVDLNISTCEQTPLRKFAIIDNNKEKEIENTRKENILNNKEIQGIDNLIESINKKLENTENIKDTQNKKESLELLYKEKQRKIEELQANPDYQAVDYEFDSNIHARENKEVNLNKKEENRINIDYENVEIARNNKTVQLNIEDILANKKEIRNNIYERAQGYGFTKLEAFRLSLRANPAIDAVLDELNNEELFRNYYIGIILKTPLAINIKYNLEGADKNSKIFKQMNKYAKKDLEIPGVTAKGLKYNVRDKIKGILNKNKTLDVATSEEKEIPSETKIMKSKSMEKQEFLNSLKTNIDMKNISKEELEKLEELEKVQKTGDNER